MLTYTGGRNLYGTLTNNSTAANLTKGDSLINQANRKVLTMSNWPFREREYTLDTVASQQFYQIPAYIDKVSSFKVTIGSTSYVAKEINSLKTWYKLNETTITSDIPEYYILLDGQLGIYPTPATADNTITFSGRLAIKDLSIADYTTGTIVTATLDGTAVVGDSTVWTAAMAGRFIRITEPNGDGYWYEIASVTDNTHLTLVKPYKGTSIAAGSANYTIGQVSLIPEDYQDIPVYEAARIYYAVIQPDAKRADELKDLRDEGLSRMLADRQGESENVVLNEGIEPMTNPNDYIWAA